MKENPSPSRKKRQQVRNDAVQQNYDLEALQEQASRVTFFQKFEGPYYVSVDTEFDWESDGLVTLEIGATRISFPFDAAETLLFMLLDELYGRARASTLMALIQRMPDMDADAETGESSRAAARALWEAAWHFRHHWPQRNDGFDDRLWGVTPPPCVTETFELGTPYRVPAEASPDYARFLDPPFDPEFTDQPDGRRRWQRKTPRPLKKAPLSQGGKTHEQDEEN